MTIPQSILLAMHRPKTLLNSLEIEAEREKQPATTPAVPQRRSPAPAVGALTAKAGMDSGQVGIEVFLPCIPPNRSAQQKGVSIQNGKPIFYTKGAVKKAAEQWRRILQPAAPKKPMEGALCLSIEFVYPWRESEKASIRQQFALYPIPTRPDAENIFKLCGDVMTELGFWHDDSQLADLRISKWWGDVPGVAIELTQAKPRSKAIGFFGNKSLDSQPDWR